MNQRYSQGNVPELQAEAGLETLLRRFDRAWQQGERPCIEDYLPADSRWRSAALIELVHMDLEYRLKAGESADVASCLARFPELGQDEQTIGELAKAAQSHQASAAQRAAGQSAALLPAQFGRFRVLGLVGAGACATVYRAWDSELEREVALKIPRLGGLATPRDLERFLREARSAGQLHHPHIVPVYDIGQVDGTVFLVAQLIPGRTLAEQPRPVEACAAARLIAQVAEALHHAHQRGIVHRDLKPANILIDMEGLPHVADFGLAYRASEATITQEGELVGTPAYMAPEQLGGACQRADTRSDIYSLGVILYELLTLELPFRGSSRAVLLQVLEDEPQPPRRLNDRIPRDLETICLQAMAKEPRHRYATADELAADLRRWLAGEPVLARPVGLGTRAVKWMRRRPAVATLLALSACLLLSLLAGASYFTLKLGHQRDVARAEQFIAQRERDHARKQTQMARRNLYAADMQLAHREWQNGHSERARTLLARHQLADDDDLRGFEWYYVWQLCTRDLVLRGHSGMVNAIACLPDGQHVASGGADGTIRIWNSSTGLEARWVQAHAAPVLALALSPDGNLVASASADHTIKLWDGKSFELIKTLQGHSNSVTAVTFTPDGRLVSGSQDKTIQVWDLERGEPQSTLCGADRNRPLDGMVESLSVTHDGSLLLVASISDKLRVWDLVSGQCLHLLDGHTSLLTAVAVAPSGQIAATGSDDCTVKLWDTSTWTERITLRGHTSSIACLSFSPDGLLLATASLDGTARLWDASTGQSLKTLAAHTGPLTAVAFAADNETLITAGRDQTVRLWNVKIGKPWSSDSRHPSAISHSNRRRDVIRLQAHDGPVFSLAFGSDSRTIAVGGRTPGLKHSTAMASLWDVPSGNRLADYPAERGVVYCISFAPDGKRFFLGRQQGARSAVVVWDPQSASSRVASGDLPGSIWSMALFPDGRTMATGSGIMSQHGAVSVWNTETGDQLSERLEPGDYVRAIALAPNGRLLAAARGDGWLTVWDPSLADPILRFRAHEQRIFSAAFSPDGRTLVTGSRDASAKLWDTRSGELLGTLHGHTHTVSSVAFSGDGKSLATGSCDGTVKLWDSATMQERLTLDGDVGMIWCIAFAPDHQTLAAGTESGTVLLWLAAREPREVADRVRSYNSMCRDAEYKMSFKGRFLALERPQRENSSSPFEIQVPNVFPTEGSPKASMIMRRSPRSCRASTMVKTQLVWPSCRQ